MRRRVDIAALAQEAFERDPSTVHPVRAILNDEDTGRIVMVPVEFLEPNPDQPRKTFDPQGHEDLTASVREHGILSPLLVRKNPDHEGYILIAGERRFRAAKAAGLKEVPVLVFNPSNHLEIAIIENLQRENLSAIEEAVALAKLKEARGYTQRDLAKIIGKSEQTVSESLKLLELPSEIRAELEETSDVRSFQKSQLLEVVKAGDADKVAAAWNALKTGSLKTVRDLRQAKRPAAADEKPRHFTHTYHDDDGRYRVTVTFSKTKVSSAELKAALREAAKHIE